MHTFLYAHGNEDKETKHFVCAYDPVASENPHLAAKGPCRLLVPQDKEFHGHMRRYHSDALRWPGFRKPKIDSEAGIAPIEQPMIRPANFIITSHVPKAAFVKTPDHDICTEGRGCKYLHTSLYRHGTEDTYGRYNCAYDPDTSDNPILKHKGCKKLVPKDDLYEYHMETYHKEEFDNEYE
jgi:hypothetical protein